MIHLFPFNDEQLISKILFRYKTENGDYKYN